MFGKKKDEILPVLMDDKQIRDLAMKLITECKTPEEAGFYGDVRKRVKSAITKIAREAMLENTSDKLTSGQMEPAELAKKMFPEIIDYEPANKIFHPGGGGYTAYGTNGGLQYDYTEEYSETIPAQASFNTTNVRIYRKMMLSLPADKADVFRSELLASLRQLADSSSDIEKKALEEALYHLGLIDVNPKYLPLVDALSKIDITNTDNPSLARDIAHTISKKLPSRSRDWFTNAYSINKYTDDEFRFAIMKIEELPIELSQKVLHELTASDYDFYYKFSRALSPRPKLALNILNSSIRVVPGQAPIIDRETLASFKKTINSMPDKMKDYYNMILCDGLRNMAIAKGEDYESVVEEVITALGLE
jgi:hypothetical protein